MARSLPALLLLACALVACGQQSPGSGTSASVESSLPPFDSEAFSTRLEESERPMVVNVWASWCIPCRSEAPLLAEAHQQFGDRIDFVGVDIEDTQHEAAAFLEEFGVAYENLFDPDADIRRLLGGTGVPITYFVLPGGEVARTHFGVLDDQELALQIDELLRRS